jgi:hypothetical protein
VSTVFGPVEPTERDMIRAVNAAPAVEAMAGFDAAVPYYEAAAAAMQAYMAPTRAELEAGLEPEAGQ